MKEIEQLKARISDLEELLEVRTNELEEKNKELDNAIKVFAGRELTIRMLRKTVEKLKEK